MMTKSDYSVKVKSKITCNNTILFPETHPATCAHAGTHASNFMCAIYLMWEVIVFSFFVLLLLHTSRNFSLKDFSFKIINRKFKT